MAINSAQEAHKALSQALHALGRCNLSPATPAASARTRLQDVRDMLADVDAMLADAQGEVVPVLRVVGN